MTNSEKEKFDFAFKLHSQGKTDEALKLYEQILKQNPNNAEVLNLAGIVKLSKNKPIYLICYTGTKSLSLAKKLSSLGYQAYSFSGGFYAIEHPINNQFY